MKKKIPLIIIFSLLFIVSCTPPENKSKATIYVNESDIINESLTVKGMTCVGCEVTLEDNISNISGVVSVKASHSDDKVLIKFDSSKTKINKISEAIKSLNYEVSK